MNSRFKKFLVMSTIVALPLSASAEEKAPPKSTTDGQKAATKAAVQAGRTVVGPAVGGTAGKIITGGAVGTGVGVFLTPSEIGCGPGEGCAKK